MEARPWHILRHEFRVTDEDVIKRRMSECERCEEFFKPTKQCKICKCVMPIKTTLVNGSCPLGKWGMLLPEYRFNGPEDLDSVKYPSNNFDRIYFMHIPKTGGNHINKYLLFPFTDVAKRFAIPVDVIHSTWGFRSDKSYTISIVRDPADRTISHFAHWASYRETLGERIELTEDNLIKWVSGHQSFLSNFQSKFFVYDLAQSFAVRDFDTDERFRSLCVEKDLVIERAKMVNLLLRNDSLDLGTLNSAAVKLFSELGLEEEPLLYDQSKDSNESDRSKALRETVSASTKDWLRTEVCPVDMALYNEERLYFKG